MHLDTRCWTTFGTQTPQDVGSNPFLMFAGRSQAKLDPALARLRATRQEHAQQLMRLPRTVQKAWPIDLSAPSERERESVPKRAGFVGVPSFPTMHQVVSQ